MTTLILGGAYIVKVVCAPGFLADNNKNMYILSQYLKMDNLKQEGQNRIKVMFIIFLDMSNRESKMKVNQ